MAIEYIEGTTMQARVDGFGAMTPERALICVRELATVLDAVHQNGLVHRDIKPSNIMLRDGDFARPVFVDFGLSFNSAEDSGLTRVGEEIGNRFLRLPEHASGGRTAASDVTQLAGIFIYLVSAEAPRVLLDEANKMPHQRQVVRDALQHSLTGMQLLRVMSVFDRAFNIMLTARYPAALEFVSDLEAAMTADAGADDELGKLLTRVDEMASQRGLTSQRVRRDALEPTMRAIDAAVDAITFSRGLVKSMAGREEEFTESESWTQMRRSVHAREDTSSSWVSFRAELRGFEQVVFIDGVEAWRGEAPNQELTVEVQKAVARQILSADDNAAGLRGPCTGE